MRKRLSAAISNWFSKAPASPLAKNRSLSLEESYLCPVCRHGQITALVLTDAFACDFCRHIFTTNVAEQTVQVVDSSQPMSWRWNGQHWRTAYQDDRPLALVIWLMCLVLVSVPSGLIWLSAYIFPPLPGSRWAWFPSLWAGSAFFIHLSMVGWLLAEYYQFPLYVASKIRLRRWFDRVSPS